MKHKHHIIPKYAGESDDLSNLIYLSVEDHANAHKALYEQHGHWQDLVAYQGLAGIIPHEEAVRLACGHFKGKKHKPESLLKLQKPKSKEHAAKVGLTKRGKPRSEATRRKISETRQSRTYAPMSKDHMDKIIAKARLPKSEETKAKMSLARKQYWEQKRSRQINT